MLVLLSLVALILLSVPIAIALGAVGTAAIWIGFGDRFLINVALSMYEGATRFPLIAIPLFVLAGSIMNHTGISRRLIDFAYALIGFVRGGLAMVNVGVSMFFAEISGSAVADVAAVGSVLIPAMKKKGYPGRFAAAVTSSSASLAIIIPPSIPMILYAVIAQTSVVQLFVAGVIPGFLGGFGMMLISYFYARKLGLPAEDIFQLKRVWTTFKAAAWALTLPVIILGGILGGIVTATEGAGIAVAAALFIGLVIYRDLTWQGLLKSLVDSGVQTAVVMLLVAASAVVGMYLTMDGVPQRLAAQILGFTSNPYVILAMLNVLFLMIGMILHSASAIILVVPIVMPLVTLVGIDPVHFGVLVTLNLAIGQQTPPVASVLMTTCSIAREDIWDVTWANIPFLILLLVLLALVTYVPFVSMGLVEAFYR
ncbi:tripartite ATP-independent transporter DctM subunit [Natronocella acetinitrilica]|uniref:TRAP transporter large permease protein n=1 Tax=Natronocella acetinitrilica TaxID=414046 RepID=A0AAE3G6P0_9GAMM|nr:TRAP transporter large permease [Natronocella acetinitrilica]MCP1675746.1 tripartite ATP-independent transporter DctM subunit [Natronocella acetinitrilica]